MQKSPSCGLERVKVYHDNGAPVTAAVEASMPRRFVQSTPTCPWKKTAD
jgi:uncharacterized protein YbbK (DUF523 family)